jgi:predicted nucleic acid-binding protein
MDLLIAATALTMDIPLFTCNPTDFDGLGSLIEIVPIDAE